MAAAPEVPVVPGDVVYGTGRMDESGRVGDRAMTGALGWQPGDRLTLTAAAGVVIARRHPAGMVAMPAKPYLVIPAALQRRRALFSPRREAQLDDMPSSIPNTGPRRADTAQVPGITMINFRQLQGGFSTSSAAVIKGGLSPQTRRETPQGPPSAMSPSYRNPPGRPGTGT
jgi:hypothetical protein